MIAKKQAIAKNRQGARPPPHPPKFTSPPLPGAIDVKLMVLFLKKNTHLEAAISLLLKIGLRFLHLSPLLKLTSRKFEI